MKQNRGVAHVRSSVITPPARLAVLTLSTLAWHSVALHAAGVAHDVVAVSGTSVDLRLAVAVLTPMSRLVQSPYSAPLSSGSFGLQAALELSHRSQTATAVIETLTSQRAAVAVAPQIIDALEQAAHAPPHSLCAPPHGLEVQPPAMATGRLSAPDTAHIITNLAGPQPTIAVTSR